MFLCSSLVDINLLDNFNQYHSFNYDDFEENLSDNNNENAEILSGENEIESSNNYDENEEFFLDVSEKVQKIYQMLMTKVEDICCIILMKIQIIY